MQFSCFDEEPFAGGLDIYCNSLSKGNCSACLICNVNVMVIYTVPRRQRSPGDTHIVVSGSLIGVTQLRLFLEWAPDMALAPLR